MPSSIIKLNTKNVINQRDEKDEKARQHLNERKKVRRSAKQLEKKSYKPK